MDFDISSANVISLALLKFKTQRKLAKELGVSPQTISAWRYKQVAADKVNALSDATGIPRSIIRPDLYPSGKEPQRK